MTTNKAPEETSAKLEIIADEKAWLQSGIDWVNGARTTVEIPAEKWQAFEEWMDEPPKIIPEVQELLSMKPLWK